MEVVISGVHFFGLISPFDLEKSYLKAAFFHPAKQINL